MKNLSLLIGFLLVGCSSCNQAIEDPNNPKLLWQTPLTDSNNYLDGMVFTDVQFNGNMLFDGKAGGNSCLYSLNISSGKIQWKWNDYFENGDFQTTSIYQYQNLALIPYARVIYCIDLNTGATKWKRKEPINYYGNLVLGLGNDYYASVSDYSNGDGTFEGKIVHGDLITGNEIDVITPDYSRNLVYETAGGTKTTGFIYSSALIKINTNNALVIFFGDPLSSTDPNPYYGRVNYYFGLYDLDKKQWLYKKKEFMLNTRNPLNNVMVENGKIYVSSAYTMQCNDLISGDLCWSSNLSDRVSSQDRWIDGKILTTTQDRVTHCIDAKTGQQLWSITTSGNPGVIKEINGIAYMVGGNSKLFAIDINSGKILWQFSSLDENLYKYGYFMEGVRTTLGVNGEKGKVLLSSYKSAFCYEAIR